MINKAILIGRLTRDPDVKYLPNSTPVASFTIAVDRTFKNKDGEKEADFIPVVAWRKTAELCGTYLFKGSMVAVVGRIQTRSYESDGVKKYVTEVVADEVEFLTPKGENSRGQSAGANNSQNNNYGIPVSDGFDGFDDSGVPF